MKKFYIVRCPLPNSHQMLLYIAGEEDIRPVLQVMTTAGIPYSRMAHTRYFYVDKKYKQWIVATFLPYTPQGISLTESVE